MTETTYNRRSQEQARRRVLTVQQSGRCAELVVDTGHLLSTGRTWLAYARLPCQNVYTARMLSENLARRLSEAVAEARREAYNAGYMDARRGESPRRDFCGTI